MKIGWGLTSRGKPEKVRKSREAPIGMMCDVSPFTQGLRYRAACDVAQSEPLESILGINAIKSGL